MEHATVPGLTSALRARGYQLRGPVGVGSSGAAWAAESPDGERVVVSVVDLDLTVAARRSALARLESLRAVRHPHLVPLLDVVAIDAHRTALVTAAVDGPTVGSVLQVRPRWRAGEVVTLLAPLAGAITALHDAGLVHGDVAPENVVLAPGGRPVLVDLASVVVPTGGTPGFASPGARDDVFSLARLGTTVLDVADAPTAARLGAALDLASGTDRAARPTPAALARACFEASEPVPIEIPDAAVLARVALTRLADGSPHVRTVQDPRVARRRRLVAAVGAVAATVAVIVVLSGVGPRLPGESGAGRGVVAGSGVDDLDGTAPSIERGATTDEVVAAAVELTHRRAAVLTALAPERLDEVVLPGSAAFDADRALLEALEERGEHLEVRAEDVEARWLETRDGRELVVVTSRLRVLGSDDVPEPRSVVLALARSAGGWRVVDVLDPAEAEQVNGPVGPLAG